MLPGVWHVLVGVFRFNRRLSLAASRRIRLFVLLWLGDGLVALSVRPRVTGSHGLAAIELALCWDCCFLHESFGVFQVLVRFAYVRAKCGVFVVVFVFKIMIIIKWRRKVAKRRRGQDLRALVRHLKTRCNDLVRLLLRLTRNVARALLLRRRHDPKYHSFWLFGSYARRRALIIHFGGVSTKPIRLHLVGIRGVLVLGLFVM